MRALRAFHGGGAAGGGRAPRRHGWPGTDPFTRGEVASVVAWEGVAGKWSGARMPRHLALRTYKNPRDS